MKRYLAHRIIYRGVCYPMAVAEIADDGTVLSVRRYSGETEATIFIAGTLDLDALSVNN